MQFQSELIKWYSENKRELPWRTTKDPYLIWLSEVILQQTRVAQGLPYYERFSEQYPTVYRLAEASEMDVLKLWQGLGYYSRGRNMHATAKHIVINLAGVFPSNYEELIQLKGIGSYTAAAIASFSKNEKRAVVDGNVYRVLARYFGIYEAIDTSLGKKTFSNLANLLIEEVNPGIYNQAIMEFGAMLCKPAKPDCAVCPVRVGCYAFKSKSINELPVKSKKIIKRERFLNYLIIEQKGGLWLNLRDKGDIWQGLYDFPLLEFEKNLSEMELKALLNVDEKDALEIKYIDAEKHILTHQILRVQFFKVENLNTTFMIQRNNVWVPFSEVEKLPMPIIIQKFIGHYFKKRL